MGMRFNQCNHRGTVVANWCREVGPNLPLVANKGTAEGRDTTYAPVPFFVNLKGYGLLLRSLHYSTFDFGVKEKGRFEIENNTAELKLELFFGDQPLDIVSSYYRQTGRYTKPKPWVFGVWAAASADWQAKTTGEQVNRSVLRKCRANGIPCSAIMDEDWWWAFLTFPPIDLWELNRDEYHGYERLIAEQHNQGVKHISYFLPYFAPNSGFARSKVFQEGKAAQVFTRNLKGEPAPFEFVIGDHYQLDVTSPAFFAQPSRASRSCPGAPARTSAFSRADRDISRLARNAPDSKHSSDSYKSAEMSSSPASSSLKAMSTASELLFLGSALTIENQRRAQRPRNGRRSSGSFPAPPAFSERSR
jgi:alpha-glucosidase (family GH31 glycosyl hydrolase)